MIRSKLFASLSLLPVLCFVVICPITVSAQELLIPDPSKTEITVKEIVYSWVPGKSTVRFSKTFTVAYEGVVIYETFLGLYYNDDMDAEIAGHIEALQNILDTAKEEKVSLKINLRKKLGDTEFLKVIPSFEDIETLLSRIENLQQRVKRLEDTK